MNVSVHNSNDVSIVISNVITLTGFGEQEMYKVNYNADLTNTKVALNGNTYTSFNKNKTGTLTIKLMPNSKEFLQLRALEEFVRIFYNYTFPITILNNNTNQLSYVFQRCSFKTFPEEKGRELKELEIAFNFENYASPTLTTLVNDFI